MHPLTDEDMREDVLQLLNSRFKGRDIPIAYRILARNPELLKKFIEFRDEIMRKGVIDPTLKEKIAVKVSEVNRCEACYTIHKSKLKTTEPENEFEEKILEFAEKAARERGKAKLNIDLSDDEALELFMVISLYMFLNTFNNLIWCTR